MKIIRSNERYRFETDWLTTYWHFSFDHYHDPSNMGFGPLRVFNDDVVAPAGGFPMHGHREMEIVTYIIQGELEHKDNMGNIGRIGPGEIQRMTAGTGVLHSEYNPSKTEPVHLIQLWITPSFSGLKPSWEQKKFSQPDRTGKLLPIAVPAESNGSPKSDSATGPVQIHQNAKIYTSLLPPGQSAKHELAKGRRAYIFVIGGELNLNGETLAAGDQARVTKDAELQLSAPATKGGASADFLLLDLP